MGVYCLRQSCVPVSEAAISNKRIRSLVNYSLIKANITQVSLRKVFYHHARSAPPVLKNVCKKFHTHSQNAQVPINTSVLPYFFIVQQVKKN
ncbi:hypothetical protein BpHYR1_042715 [Brachionus plicatilis]|uniref:Uncharacterized protein n=1 Tax=Brachionus plicatilis TaxID=10195 RepID=A0A3M7PV43_BRAPC|nr:hypothetical protein BpHYR1_042715 [Brachionus plicatilis]